MLHPLTRVFVLVFRLYIRFCQHYAPQQTFGTISGVMAIVMAIPSLAIAPPLQSYLFERYGADSRKSYVYSFCGWTALSTVFSLGLCLVWVCHPPPPPGSIVITINDGVVGSTPARRGGSREDRALPIKPLEGNASINAGDHAACDYDTASLTGSFQSFYRIGSFNDDLQDLDPLAAGEAEAEADEIRSFSGEDVHYAESPERPKGVLGVASRIKDIQYY